MAERDRERPVVLDPRYKTLENEVVHPDQILPVRLYFLQKWAPLLGPVATMVVIKLREICYLAKHRNPDAREVCFPDQDALAHAVGISRRTLIRTVNGEGDEARWIERFIRRRTRADR